MNIINLSILLILTISVYLVIYYKTDYSKNTQLSSSSLVKSSLNPNEYYPILVDDTNSFQSLVTDPLDLNYNISTGTLFAKDISANFNGTSVSALNLEKNGTGNLLIQTNPSMTSLLPQGNSGQVLVSQLNNIPIWINAPISSGLSYMFPNATFFGTGTSDMTYSGSAGGGNKPIYCKNFTVSSGGVFFLSETKLFVSDTLTINGSIINNGQDANNQNGGFSGRSYPGDTRNIGRGTTALQSYATSSPPSSSNVTTLRNSNESLFRGGNGGSILNDISNGKAGNANIVSNLQSFLTPPSLTKLKNINNISIDGGSGGGCGQTILDRSTNITYLGGGGGGGGGVIHICANKIIFGTGGTIEAKGGNGANGQVDSSGTIRGGGGGGGGGGLIFIVTRSITGASPTYNVNGGSGGNSSSSNTNFRGQNGQSGRVVIVNL